MNKKISRSIARQILEAAKGTFFGVIFEKKDGTRREMQACIPRPKPDAKRPNPAFYNPDLVLVLDISLYRKNLKELKDKELAKNKSYRSIPLSRVLELHINHKKLEIEG